MIVFYIALLACVTGQSMNANTPRNMFGTDGIRRTVGVEPFTAESLPRLGRAIARWAEKKYGPHPKVLLGHDTRLSCAFVKGALKSGLLQSGVHIDDTGVLPTPAVCLLVDRNAVYDFGIVISASHNPYHDNGIKIIDGNTIKLTIEDEETITYFFNADAQYKIKYDMLGSQEYWYQAEREYIKYIVAQFPTNFLRGYTIVLDCAHGATHVVAPRIFKKCGARIITLHNQPSGTNINNRCGSQHVERLQGAVREYNANVGFAFDGDGDRMIAVNKHGQVKDGDDILALLLSHPRYVNQKAVVGTIMSNEGLRVYVESLGKILYRTSVGDKYVAQKLEQEDLLLGGEQSGHTILRNYLKTGDGVMAALYVMETAIKTNNMDLNTFDHYPQLLINVPIVEKKDLNSEPIATIIQEHEKKLRRGRIVVRYSGTENCIRVMVEDNEKTHTQEIAQSLAQALKQELS